MKSIALALALASIGTAQAATFDFSGNISTQKDVVQIQFSLTSDATNVRVWTDSFLSATNFDPITSVWVQSGTDYKLVGQNDDNGSIATGQTYYDSGLVFSSLSAGNYLFTIGAYNNWASGTLLSQGFVFDNATPVALATWCQPASHCGMGTSYSVHLTGVDSATNVTAVPEPETYAMMLAGISLLGAVARRRKQKNS